MQIVRIEHPRDDNGLWRTEKNIDKANTLDDETEDSMDE